MQNLENVTFEQLVEHLNEIETSRPRVGVSDKRIGEYAYRYDLVYEVGITRKPYVDISNIELMCDWSKIHGYSMSLEFGLMIQDAQLTIHFIKIK